MAKFRRILAIAMVMCMFVTVLPMQALAANDEGDNLTTYVHPTETHYTYDENGVPTVVVEISKADTTGTNAEGADVVKTETTTTTTTLNPDGSTQVVTKVEGSETTNKVLELPEGGVSVDIPNEVGKSNEKEFGDTSMNGVPTGDVKQGEDDTEYNQTITDVTPGKVTVSTTEKTYEEKFDGDAELEYTTNQTTPNDENDLRSVGQASEEYLPGYEGETKIPEMVEGYDYVYVGAGNTPVLIPAIVYDKPMSKEDKIAEYGDEAYISASLNTSYLNHYIKNMDEEERNSIAYEGGVPVKDSKGKIINFVTDEEGYILNTQGERVVKGELTSVDPNGNTTYLHRFDATGKAHKVEGWYENGEWVQDLNGEKQYVAVWAGPQQFLLVDGEGNVITTYCADQTDPTEKGFGYNMENVEDADYYSEEEAAHIRTIAKNGYWGTVGTTTDEEGNEVPVEGSLAYMRQKLLESGEFSEKDLESLTDGVALSATQMAIWSYSNKMSGINFVNAHYSTSTNPNAWGLTNTEDNRVPTDKEDEIKLMYRIYTHLINLEGSTTNNKMDDTIITGENAIRDMSINVIQKAEEHENNADDDDKNDAYVTDLSFALVVEPSGDEEESLKVTVVTAGGQTIVGRICGNKENEDEVDLERDGNGNYWFRGIVLTEGDQTFTLNLEGVQNLKQGVYLYSSEVRGEETSQTLVGMASGKRDFDVTMSLSFELDVDEGLVVTERVWESEHDPITYPPAPINEEPQIYRLNHQDGLEEIADEEVPLAAPVTTGDSSIVWVVVIAMSMLMLCAFNLAMAKRPRGKHEAV